MSKSSDDPWEIFNGYIRIFCGDSTRGEKPDWGDNDWDGLLKRMWEKIRLDLTIPPQKPSSLESSALEILLSNLEKTLSSLLNNDFKIRFLPIGKNGYNLKKSIPGYHFFRFILEKSNTNDSPIKIMQYFCHSTQEGHDEIRKKIASLFYFFLPKDYRGSVRNEVKFLFKHDPQWGFIQSSLIGGWKKIVISKFAGGRKEETWHICKDKRFTGNIHDEFKLTQIDKLYEFIKLIAQFFHKGLWK